MTYAIGQKVRYKPHHPGDVWAAEPWYIHARVERYSVTTAGAIIHYEVTPHIFASRIDCFVRADMLEPWKEEE